MLSPLRPTIRTTGLLSRVAPLLVIALAAHATGTAPALAIHSVEADSAKEDGVLLRVEGTYPFQDLIDLPYPLQLFVYNKEDFLLFSGAWGSLGGELRELKDAKQGLTEEIVQMIGRYAERDFEAQVLNIAPGRIEVLLPEHFPSGHAIVQLMVQYRGTPLFSNPVEIEIKKESW